MIKLIRWPNPFNEDSEIKSYCEFWKDKMHMHGQYFMMPYGNVPLGPFQRDQINNLDFAIDTIELKINKTCRFETEVYKQVPEIKD